VSVQLRDGVQIELATGETFVADASCPSGDINFVSHAHGDHLFDHTELTDMIICSDLTAPLAKARRPDANIQSRSTHEGIELLPSGHTPRSIACLIDDGEQRYLYTGDVSTRDRSMLDGFEPVVADVLILESTYGKPGYEFPSQQTMEDNIVDWLDETTGTPLLLFGYTLGRAQEIQLLVQRSDRPRMLFTDAIQRINEVIASRSDVSFPATIYDSEESLRPNDVLVLPSQTNNLTFV